MEEFLVLEIFGILFTAFTYWHIFIQPFNGCESGLCIIQESNEKLRDVQNLKEKKIDVNSKKNGNE